MKTKILRTKILGIWTNGYNHENDAARLEKMFSGNNGKEGFYYDTHAKGNIAFK